MIHLIGLPHTEFDEYRYSACAFTAKAVRLARMLDIVGRDLTVYWGGDTGADVCCMSSDEQQHHFGSWRADALPAITWDATLAYWRSFHDRVVAELDRRLEPGDIIAVVGGAISQEIVDRYKDRYVCIEPGVGYEGICRDTFACFESYAWMHNRYGAYGIGDGRALDAVIPNAVDPIDWHTDTSNGYALFVGRLIQRKGPHAAVDIANRAGLPLVMMGAGVTTAEPGRIVATDGTVIEGDVTHIGARSGRARAEVFAKAEVFICPTLYIGPWEGVHAESLMSGVGVAAPDYGVFTETLPRRCRYRRMSEALDAVEAARELRSTRLRSSAIRAFGIERCAEMYDDWLDRVESVTDGRGGWYS